MNRNLIVYDHLSAAMSKVKEYIASQFTSIVGDISTLASTVTDALTEMDEVKADKTYVDTAIADLDVAGYTELDSRLTALENMVISGEVYAPLASSDDGSAILIDDSGEALVAEWSICNC